MMSWGAAEGTRTERPPRGTLGAGPPRFLAGVGEPDRCFGGKRLKTVARARAEGRADRRRARGQEGRRKDPIPRSHASLRVFFLLLAALAIPLAASCSPSIPEVEGRWTGSLKLGNGGVYDPVRLDLVQGGERLSGSGVMVAGVPGPGTTPRSRSPRGAASWARRSRSSCATPCTAPWT